MKRRMMTLGGYVQCTKISPEFASQDQRSKVKVTGDKKRKSAALCSGVVFWGAVLMWHFFASGPRGRGSRGLACVPVLRRWENQRILSSLNQVNEWMNFRKCSMRHWFWRRQSPHQWTKWYLRTCC